jgi:hypothetical protein
MSCDPCDGDFVEVIAGGRPGSSVGSFRPPASPGFSWSLTEQVSTEPLFVQSIKPPRIAFLHPNKCSRTPIGANS